MTINLKKSSGWVPGRGLRTVGTTGRMRLPAASSGPTVVTSGLVLYLDAGNTASYPGTGTTWTDLSGNGNNATMFNSPTWDSLNGFAFNGINQYGTTSMTGFSSGTGSRTISTWFIPIGDMNTQHWAYYYGNETNGQISGLGVVSSVMYVAGFFADVTTSYAASSGTRYNLAFTYNGSSVTVYVNGVAIYGPTLVTWNTVLSNASIARLGPAFGQYYQGSISEIMVYNRALTASELLQNYNVTKSRYGL